MSLVKTHYDRVLLLCSALILIAVCVWFFLQSKSFDERNEYAPIVAIVKGTAGRDNKITVIEDETNVKNVSVMLHKPNGWKKGNIPLMCSSLVFLKDNKPQIGTEGGPFHPPIPNDWVLQYEALVLTEADLLTQDPDQDGFNNLEEWRGDPSIPDSVVQRPSTSPVDDKSHPAYTTKLFLKRAVRVPLPITFSSVPSPDTFIINTDPSSPSQFVHKGDVISEQRPGQPERKRYKVLDYKEKFQPHPSIPNLKEDVSELTLLNQETGETVTLVRGGTIDSPDSYAEFEFIWKEGVPSIVVKKGGEFTLKPQPDIQYKLIDINDSEAVIQDVKSKKSLKILKRQTP